MMQPTYILAARSACHMACQLARRATRRAAIRLAVGSALLALPGLPLAPGALASQNVSDLLTAGDRDSAARRTRAALDNFEYSVAEVVDHRPKQRRTGRGRKLPKKDFEFLVRWADLPEDESNPSWEPWTNTSLRTCAPFEQYCSRPDVVAQLGADFCVAEAGEGEAQRKQ